MKTPAVNPRALTTHCCLNAGITAALHPRVFSLQGRRSQHLEFFEYIFVALSFQYDLAKSSC